MKTLRLVLIASALGLASPVALAFEQTQAGGSGGAIGASESGATAGRSGVSGNALDNPLAGTVGVPGVSLSEPATKKESGGYEIRLPMIGVIGKLPKLDFGLELLYGADKDKPIEEDLVMPQVIPDDGVTIRGTVKHRF